MACCEVHQPPRSSGWTTTHTMPLLLYSTLLTVLLVGTAGRCTPRSLLLNTTADLQLSLPRFPPLSASVEDAVLNSQWDLLLRFRQDNAQCDTSPDLSAQTGNLSGWPTARPMSAFGWPGVTVKNHRIVAINFNSRSLCSAYPAYWSALTSLTSLNLANNGGITSSSLPASWGRLSSLKYLNLSGNFIEGPIPYAWANLTALTALELSGSGLNIGNHQPTAFWKALSRLQYLDLSRNNIVDGAPFPLAWTALKSLLHLDLHGVTSSSEEFGVTPAPAPWPVHLSSLSNLRYLDLNGADLSGKPPAEWSKLRKLEALKIAVQSPLNGPDLPAAWSGMKSLRHLDLPDLTWPGMAAMAPGQPLLPQSWANLSSLRSLTTPCSNLLSKPAHNGIPIAPYLTALSVRCPGQGCGGAEQVTQLGILSRMTNLQAVYFNPTPRDDLLQHEDISVTSSSCLPPGGAYTLPVEWAKLTKLTSLTIVASDYVPDATADKQPDGMMFHPILPPSWSTLVRLEVLDIDCTGWALRFGGPLPTSWSTLTALSSLTAKAAYCSSETVTDYPGNASGGLPAQWSKLTRLQVVDLQDYGLQGVELVSTWSALKKLNTLNLQGNCVGGRLPASWGNLHHLENFTLPDTRLWTADGICSGRPRFSGPLPGSWGALTKLTALLLADNDLSGTIPSSWSALQLLRAVTLSRNNLTGPLPSSWSRLTKLTQLEATGNLNLNGQLPTSWSRLVNLVSLDLSVNELTGQPPASWGSLSALFSLDLSSNRLRGTIPSSWANMLVKDATGKAQCPPSVDPLSPCAITLKINNNFLSGSLPASWGIPQLSSTAVIDFSSNQLAGPLPTTAWSVAALNLSHNSLSGSLPETWAFFTIASYKPSTSSSLTLDLSCNNFSGTLPASWTVPITTDREASLFLSHNHLVGTVPQSYAQFLNLDLSSNSLVGTVLSPFWCNSGARQYAGAFAAWNLSINVLSGLPATSCNHPNVVVRGSVDYSHNRLSGSLPPGWFSVPTVSESSPSAYVVTLDMSCNNMTGVIPESWANVAYLNLSHNQLGGRLPKVWGKRWSQEDVPYILQGTDMLLVDLSYNELQGPLPLTMYAVRHLDTSHNQLNGSVPPSQQWTSSGLWGSLTYVDLSNNSFTGKAPVQPKGAKYFNIQGNRFTGK